MRSYEVRGRTGRTVRKKSRRGGEEEEEGAGRLGSRYDVSQVKRVRQRVGQDPEEKRKF